MLSSQSSGGETPSASASVPAVDSSSKVVVATACRPPASVPRTISVCVPAPAAESNSARYPLWPFVGAPSATAWLPTSNSTRATLRLSVTSALTMIFSPRLTRAGDAVILTVGGYAGITVCSSHTKSSGNIQAWSSASGV